MIRDNVESETRKYSINILNRIFLDRFVMGFHFISVVEYSSGQSKRTDIECRRIDDKKFIIAEWNTLKTIPLRYCSFSEKNISFTITLAAAEASILNVLVTIDRIGALGGDS